jgi:RNA 3'-terminal phosphate cyclase (ATP)
MSEREEALRIDGAQGEGGGQVLRTALALSAIRTLPVEIHAIRARRNPPGLQPQHLTAVSALERLCEAQVDGAAPGSQRLNFVPRTIRAGEYRFDVGTAGSVALVLQAILLPLALAPGPSHVTLTGGTHVPWSPPVEYLASVLFPALAAMGIRARLSVERWGFYPKGGGRVQVTIEGDAAPSPMAVVAKAESVRLRGVSGVANLPGRIAERQRDRALGRLRGTGLSAQIEVQERDAAGPGSFLFLEAERGGLRSGFFTLGERGKPAEQVADEAVDALLDFLRGEYGCDPHLADQLVVPMALAAGTSRLTTSRVSQHLLTTLQIVQQILGCPVQIGGEEGQPGALTIEGVGKRAEGRELRKVSGQSGDRTIGDSAASAASREPRAETRGGGAVISKRGAGAAPDPAGAQALQQPERAAPPGRSVPGPDGPERMALARLPGAEVRKARAADVPAMQLLIAHFAARGELLPRTLNELYVHLRDFFVCVVGGEVIGICALSLYWEDLAEVRTLAVREEHGGKGLGAALVTGCLDEAARLGVRRVFALTYRPGFFARLGFREIDKRELPQKIWKDCIKCAKFANCDEVALVRDTPGL